MGIKTSIANIKEDIKKYSPHPERVKLVAVSKYVTTKEIEEALETEHEHFGENRVQIIREKKEYFDSTENSNKIKWHFIGNLQKNKVKYIIDYIDLVHSVNKLSLAKELNKRAGNLNRKIQILLEINISEEESKEGYILEKLYEEIDEITKLEHVEVVGLMTMAPYSNDMEMVRGLFKKLSQLKDTLNKDYFNGSLIELSMGMTNDYKIALEEGSTIIRIGSKIFS